jgi:DNA topoisomerase VI subunit B
VWVKAKQQGDFYNWKLKDTGIGVISVQEIPKIFDPVLSGVQQVGGMDLGGGRG